MARELNVESLEVSTFETGAIATSIPGDIRCCTGCTSGCGINPTAGGCESKSGDIVCPADPVFMAAAEPAAAEK